MRQFNISIRSVQQLKAFVALAMVQPFSVLVGNEHQQVNGKGFMGMLSLDCSHPLCVSVKCSEEEFGRFRKETDKIFV